MAVDLGQTLSLDVQPALDSLSRLSGVADATAAAIQANNATTNKTFAEAAQQATAYSNALARQQQEVAAAAEAIRSAKEELRRLSDQQKELTAAQAKLNSATAEYQRLGKEVEKNRQAIVQVKAAIAESTQAVRDERAAVEQLREGRRQEANVTREVAAAAKDAAAAAKQEAAAAKEAGAASQAAGGSTSIFGSLLSKAGGLFAGLFAVNKLKEVGQDIIDTTAEFERLEAVITTINGGDEDKGKLEFAALRQFTLRNPFEVKAVTEAYVQLRNRGISPTLDQLQSLADLAAASGKSFDQVTEGLLGATTGQYRRLKEFGVTAKQQGDTVAFTFRGITTVVQKSQEAIADYVLGLGQLNGVAGATERIMNTTGGRITNLKDSFTELFATIGEGTDGPLNGFIKKLTTVVTNLREAIKTVDQKATDQVAKTNAVNDYGAIADQIFAKAREQATKEGVDVAQAIQQRAAQQQLILNKQLSDAEAKAAKFNLQNSDGTNNEENVAFYHSYTSGGIGDPGGKRYAQDQVAAVARVKTIRAEIAILQERAAVAIKGSQDEADQLGRIERLRAKIAADTKERDETADTVAGNKRRVELNALLKDENKLLDELLGKEEKVRKARQYSYESQLRALLQERATLESLARKAAIQVSDSASERARLTFEQSLQTVDALKAKLEQRETDLRAAALKAGGTRAVRLLGEKADGRIDGPQAEQLTALRVSAVEAYYRELEKIEREREQRLFDLRAESNRKDIEAIDRKYDKLFEAAKDNIEREAIQEARFREQVALRQRQEQSRIDTTASIATANATTIGTQFGPGTGISVIEAKRAEARAVLEIQQQAARDTLTNAKLLNDKERELAQANATARIAEIGKQLDALDQEKAKHKATDSLYKLVFGENDSDELRQQFEQTASQVIGAINQILSAQLAAEQAKVQAHQDNITSLQSQLAAEIQLNREGSASNIQGILDQLAAEKQAKKDALAESRRIAKEQQLVNDLQTISSLSLAVANIIAGWSTVPLAGSILGIVAAAATVASFVSTKASLRSAAETPGFFVGGPTGGQSIYEERGVVHGKEFVFDNQKTATYQRALFDPLHQGRPQDIDWHAPEMLSILPNLELPGQLRAERLNAQRVQLEHSFTPLQAKFDALHAELAEIKASNQTMAERPDRLTLPDGSVYEVWPNGNTKYTRFSSSPS